MAHRTGRIALDDINEGNAAAHVLEPMQVMRKHCGAARFGREPKGLCCNDGKVQLALPPPLPEQLQELMVRNSQFRKNARTWNQAFAFTSLGATKVDQRVAGYGVYSFRVNGQMHHLIGTFPQRQHTQCSMINYLLFFKHGGRE